ncbi:sensor histidine kinase [Paenibacillus sp.]|uniref:sensor histidine kinase n=1 Tax=Paenibacillus sp. TaxID=58172 RepID=UPI002D466B57|nr:sensor histidine kinase [Paenibacillus sp.]HZG57504.1 sensor histidine kinase [Paenibacillus sp.]
MNVEVDAIERVLKNATEALESSKYHIYEIGEAARQEQEALSTELQRAMEELDETIRTVDKLEEQYRRARVRLVEVSRDFKKYGEKDIRDAYETATQLQLSLSINREKESNLKSRRDDLQKRIRNIDRTIERAEALFSQMNVVLEYLSGDLGQVTRILESAKNRQLLGLKIILAQEDERRRIAREIHDGPAQSMANLILRTDIAERMLAKGEYDVVKAELADLKQNVRTELEEVRKIIFNLRPMALDDLGLVPTIRKLTQDFEEKMKIRTRFELRGKERRLATGMEVALFRLVQESLTNVAKHADATHATVEMSFLGDSAVRVVIADNGVGFDLNRWSSKAAAGESASFGLVGMRERVELLEGKFEIESNVNAGTKIAIEVPLDDGSKEEENHG